MDCRPTYHEIDLDRLVENFHRIKDHVGEGVLVMPTVKADAYGHGAIPCARALVEAGAIRLAVAMVDEAVALRQAGIQVPILVLGSTADHEIPKLLEYGITPTVYQTSFAQKLQEAARESVAVHVKVDTGMNRIGFGYREEADRILEVTAMEKIQVEGVFSHFATSDEEDKTFARLQLERFQNLLKVLEEGGLKNVIRHMANSGAILDLPESHMDLVRPGILLYGMYPSEQVDRSRVKVRPVKRFVTHISHIKTVEAGESVSYGRTFTATAPTKVATLPVGYADGYSRLLSNKAQVMIRGQRHPVIGTICMDQAMVDVTGADQVEVGSEVTLYGDDPSMEEVARIMGTISYEVTCMNAKRVPKVYLQDGIPTCLVEDLLGPDGNTLAKE
ncbi:alanine racemase [Alkalibacter rhizosphaerae]|uniref:Alanine racemase n=1 Tax=Alkalibacter rhizosphaerae TaxID=2815577 RepID=A0A974XFL6_9FIRM|nr:alanine racemase [Alkalibacter rhizosphaerae]QSX07730.1 alanine racemase [Alkalibacter rhizosphaerae]